MRLGLVIDLDVCVGCHACAIACKEWNASGTTGPLSDYQPYGARELDRSSGTMKKCTLCVDRIYDLDLPVEERQPSCVLTCPAHARMFGDFDDPDSAVSRVVRERSGYGLMPELNYNPTNQYLPPRSTPVIPIDAKPKGGLKESIKQFANKLVRR